MRAGIIGVGHLAGALTEGLCAPVGVFDSIRLSPRSRDRARALAARFEEVSVAADNQEVLDAADVVMVAVLPGQAEQALRGLRFREDHVVVSLMATVPMARVARSRAGGSITIRASPNLTATNTPRCSASEPYRSPPSRVATGRSPCGRTSPARDACGTSSVNASPAPARRSSRRCGP